MRTVEFKFVFEEWSDGWSCRIEYERYGLSYVPGLHPAQWNARKPGEPAGKRKAMPDPLYVNEATGTFLKSAYPKTHRHGKEFLRQIRDGLKSFAEFRAGVVEATRYFALDVAKQFDVLLVPTNGAGKFWTPKFIEQLNNVLKRPGTKAGKYYMQAWLLKHWETEKFFKLDRATLAKRVNAALGTDYTPNKVWKAASEILSLKTDRVPGPLPTS